MDTFCSRKSGRKLHIFPANPRAYLLRSAELARRGDSHGGLSTSEPESRRTDPREAARMLIGFFPTCVAAFEESSPPASEFDRVLGVNACQL